MIAIVSAIYVFAIILVAFLGVQSEIHNATINVETIVLKDVAELAEGEEYTYYRSTTQQDNTTRVYSITVRPLDENIDENNYDVNGNLWEINEVKFNYIIKIWNFKYIYENSHWKDGQQNFFLNAYALPEDSKQDLRYILSNISEEYVTVSQEGVVRFEQKLTSVATFNLTISSTDTSGVKSYINFIVAPY